MLCVCVCGVVVVRSIGPVKANVEPKTKKKKKQITHRTGIVGPLPVRTFPSLRGSSDIGRM